MNKQDAYWQGWPVTKESESKPPKEGLEDKVEKLETEVKKLRELVEQVLEENSGGALMK